MCFSVMIKRDFKDLGLDINLAWIREDLSLFDKRSSLHPKLFPPMQDRIFQGSYAAVIRRIADQSFGIAPMRYGVYEPLFIKDKKISKAFNARRDNLSAAYWSEAFQKHHGFVVISGFYEWVAVADLLKAGLLSIAEITLHFAREIEERKAKVLASGKKYSLTATEKMKPHLRKIVVKFSPTDHKDLFVPVVYTERMLNDGELDYGFAIVTTQPQAEILAAGHDRSPVFLRFDAIMEWMNLNRARSLQEFQMILESKPMEYFAHGF